MTTGDRVVVFSERLGELGDQEREVEATTEARVLSVPLWSHEDILESASEAEIVVIGAVEPFDQKALRTLRRCTALIRRGAGLDNVDVEAAIELGIAVGNVPDASVEEVSDHALALLLALERRLFPLDRGVRAGEWREDPDAFLRKRRGVRRLSTLTLGIVGLGRIGRRLAEKSGPIFGRIIAFDPYASEPMEGVEPVGFEALLAESDLVSVHAPLTEETRHLFDEKALRAMKPTAYLVNTARGALIDEVALAECLRQGRLAGAALDVAETEPLPSDSPLLGFESVMLTGHSAAHSETSTEELRRRVVEAVIAVLSGHPPPDLVNPEVLERPTLRLGASMREES